MGKETQKLYNYRKDNGYDEYFFGKGVDIGCGPDLLSKDVFTNITDVAPYDFAQGDANTCSNVKDETYDFVYSSHCLEHMFDPYAAFENWLRICKPGGYMIHAVPHELFYEKCQWPSRNNTDHKSSWTFEWKSSLPKTVHVPDFLEHFSDKMETIFAGTILLNFNFNKFYKDQTRGAAICQIEMIGKKK
jgi:ubiquinone/menaquinone biosynthesis C-methylase UbiE